MQQIVRTSRLAAPSDVVWRHAASPQGVNRELAPFLRMTFPPDFDDLTSSWQPGERLFRAWILLLGILPVEYDDLAFVEVEEGRRFLERSELLTQRIWEHERIVEAAGAGCTLTDRVRFEPRVRWLGPLARRIVAALFAWRHRRLRRLFG
ncbi:MAG: hypothetical protein DWQ36_02875 [Acidobacteria bacterium]|nr:MAG: hypothetical protein DWQ30_02530 [Acidobacteriota bacterium]REK11070.1 MAG: hypothetical protein DWQ36_02875 [Acidobacteriota bacterium]